MQRSISHRKQVRRTLGLLVGVSLATYLDPSFACFAPIGGAKYDAQIEITKLAAADTFQVSVPRYMEDLPNEAEVMLAYSDTAAGGMPIYEPYEVLETNVRGDRLVAEFQIERRAESKPYIVVMWWLKQPGACGIQANSGFIEAGP